MTVQRMLKEETTGADAVAQVLADAGIDTVFGISGGHVGRIFAALEKHQNDIRTIVVRHETLGSVMAEVRGRLTRKPGVLLGQGSWVLGNGLIGTIEAMMSSSPMLLLADFTDNPQFTAHAPYQSGTGDYGSWDARRAFGGVTKQVFQPRDPIPAVQQTQLAIKHALSGQPGPVAVLYSGRALAGSIDPDSRPRIYPTRYYLPGPPRGACREEVDAAAAALLAAKKPVIIAGNGVRVANAYEPLRKLSEDMGIPVATTPTGKGVFSEAHPLALGTIGAQGSASANGGVGDADLLLVIGSKLGATDTAMEHPDLIDPERQTLIQAEVEPKNASWTFPVEYPLVGDAAVIIEQLAAATAGVTNQVTRRQDGERRVAAYRSKFGYFDTPGYDDPRTPIYPQRAIGELIRNLPDDAVVTLDAGENRIFMMHLYKTRSSRSFLQAAGAGPMGYAVPAALGAKLVDPQRVAVAVAGDGGFAMTMHGMITALENDIPIIAVVFNNRALGWVKHDPSIFADLSDVDYAAIARAMGCGGVRVTEPDAIGPAIREAIASRRPCVIDVIMSADSMTFRDVMSPLMNPPAPAPSRT